MSRFTTFAVLRDACLAAPDGDDAAEAAVRARQSVLTKPPGSLGRLEDLVAWMARWQQRAMPRLDSVDVIIFAGNHGVVARGVSPYPQAVTAQMVANFEAGGAAINQLAANAGARLRVVPLDLETPTADIVEAPALSEAEFLAAVTTGYESVPETCDLLCVGEMGIGNTTIAAAVAAGLFGGGGMRWVGRGTGLDPAGIVRKRAVVDAALARHEAVLNDPLRLAAALGGRELAAMLGAVLAARHLHVPVLLDGFVTTAAAAPLAVVREGLLAHTTLAHISGEPGHFGLSLALGLSPLLDLGMRLGEGSGAALAVPLLRGALACHTGMASFTEAGVSNRS